MQTEGPGIFKVLGGRYEPCVTIQLQLMNVLDWNWISWRATLRFDLHKVCATCLSSVSPPQHFHISHKGGVLPFELRSCELSQELK